MTNGASERQITVDGHVYVLRLILNHAGQAERVAASRDGREVHTVHLTSFMTIVPASDAERAAVIPAAFAQLEADLQAGRS
ncbi:MAG: hypothetical protein ABWY00_09820 [Dongiaceae bacterium]